MKKHDIKIGDWGFITGANRADQNYWDKQFKKGFFGKVIEISKRFSPFDGKRFDDHLLLRCYTKDGITHFKTTPKYFKKHL